MRLLPEQLLPSQGVDEVCASCAPFGPQATGGRPLSCLAYHLIQRQSLVGLLQLDEQRLATFLMAVEDQYPSNSYHNRSAPLSQ